jgi:hypothetical protein
MDIALQLRVPDVVERVDAADQLIEFEDRLSGRIVLRQGAQLADQRALAISFSPKVAMIRSTLSFSGMMMPRSICPAGDRRYDAYWGRFRISVKSGHSAPSEAGAFQPVEVRRG